MQFSIRLASSTYANSTLMLRPVTVFAPINMAFQQFPRSDKDESLVLYHISKCCDPHPHPLLCFAAVVVPTNGLPSRLQPTSP